MKEGNFLWNYKKSFRLEGRSVPFQMLDLGPSHSSVPNMLFGCSFASDTLRTYGLQHARLPCLSPSPRVCSNLSPLSRWYHQPSHPLSTPSPPAQYLLCWLLITGILSISVWSSPAQGSGLDACPLTLHLMKWLTQLWYDSSLWKMSQGIGKENIRENQILIFCPAANVVTPY